MKPEIGDVVKEYNESLVARNVCRRYPDLIV